MLKGSDASIRKQRKKYVIKERKRQKEEAGRRHIK
jgi:hypothetical protein